MEHIIDFIVDNIFPIITVCLFLIFTLIGYFFESKNKAAEKEKKILNKIDENIAFTPIDMSGEISNNTDATNAEEKIEEPKEEKADDNINLEELNKK